MDGSANVESLQRTVKQLIHQNAEKLLEVGLNELQVSCTSDTSHGKVTRTIT